MQKVLILLSGGLDSTVLLARAVHSYGAENVIALSIFYGQKHSKEQEYAKFQADKYGVVLHFADLSGTFKFNTDECSLLQGSSLDLAHETYTKQLEESKGKPVSTYVPFRNGLFLAYAAAVALQFHCGYIHYGAHLDDAAGNAYPDCSQYFITQMGNAIHEGTGGQVNLYAPWQHLNKAEIVRKGIEYEVDFAHTWSCYEGKDEPCGTCGTCRDRKAAFEVNGIYDLK